MSEVCSTEPAPEKPRSRFAFLLRPWFVISATIFAILLSIAAGYRASRLAGIPPIDEIVDRETEGRVAITPEENAFTYYKRAWKLMPPRLDRKAIRAAMDVLDTGDSLEIPPAAQNCLRDCEAALTEWERGTKCDRGVRVEPADLRWGDDGNISDCIIMRELAILRSSQSLHDGQPEDSWRWLHAVFRFTRHRGNPGSISERYHGAMSHVLSGASVAAWAAHKDVTAEHLKSALSDLRELDRLTSPNLVTLKAEYLSVVKHLESPGAVRELAAAGDFPDALLDVHLFLNAEPDVCRVLLRHVYANHLSQCDLPRWERTYASTSNDLFLPTGRESPPLMDVVKLDEELSRSSVAESFYRSLGWLGRMNLERTHQIALELCLSVELFRRRHGRYPETLDALVPDFIDEVPHDIYGSGPNDRMLMARRAADPSQMIFGASFYKPGLVIYSRGPDGIDDGSRGQGSDFGVTILDPSDDVAE
jgi:hypothetical protein